MEKFSDNQNFYEHGEPFHHTRRTKNRLDQLQDLGFEFKFNYFRTDFTPTKLFIDNVWNYTEQGWNDYIGHIITERKRFTENKANKFKKELKYLLEKYDVNILCESDVEFDFVMKIVNNKTFEVIAKFEGNNIHIENL